MPINSVKKKRRKHIPRLSKLVVNIYTARKEKPIKSRFTSVNV